MLDITPEGFVLRERALGVTIEQIQQATAGKLVISDNVPEIKI